MGDVRIAGEGRSEKTLLLTFSECAMARANINVKLLLYQKIVISLSINIERTWQFLVHHIQKSRKSESSYSLSVRSTFPSYLESDSKG